MKTIRKLWTGLIVSGILLGLSLANGCGRETPPVPANNPAAACQAMWDERKQDECLQKVADHQLKMMYPTPTPEPQ